jgi:nicotinamidase-related amidase
MPNTRRTKEQSKLSLDGNVPDRSNAVLLLVDVINDLDFPNNEALIRNSVPLGKSIARLKARCKKAGIPTIYVNDNFGKWRSEFSAVLRHSLRSSSPGRPMVELLVPETEDYIVLKPKHSAFYATPLETILSYIGAKNMIVAGITTNACVMLMAGGLYVREYRIFVPRDCVAALNHRDHRTSLKIMETSYGADTSLSSRLALARLSQRT